VREPTLNSLIAEDAGATRHFGRQLARGLAQVESAFVIALEGELGAGKTTLVSGLMHGLGLASHVRSPTYTLIEPYELAGRIIYHLDLYRLIDPSEVEPLGLRDLLDPEAVLLIEWPEKGEGALPPIDLAIRLAYEGERRRIAWQLHSEAAVLVMQAALSSAKP